MKKAKGKGLVWDGQRIPNKQVEGYSNTPGPGCSNPGLTAYKKYTLLWQVNLD